MVQQHKVAGYDAFLSLVGGLNKTAAINVYFTGSKDAAGKSWCPDCNDGKYLTYNTPPMHSSGLLSSTNSFVSVAHYS